MRIMLVLSDLPDDGAPDDDAIGDRGYLRDVLGRGDAEAHRHRSLRRLSDFFHVAPDLLQVGQLGAGNPGQ